MIFLKILLFAGPNFLHMLCCHVSIIRPFWARYSIIYIFAVNAHINLYIAASIYIYISV